MSPTLLEPHEYCICDPKSVPQPYDHQDLFTVMTVQMSSMITSRKNATPIAIAVTIHHLQPTFSMRIPALREYGQSPLC